jgi:type I restriction enzyme, S subunit
MISWAPPISPRKAASSAPTRYSATASAHCSTNYPRSSPHEPRHARHCCARRGRGASQRLDGLPQGWCSSTLDDVASINPATAFDGLADNGEIPFVTMAAVAEETGILDVSRRRPVAEVRKGYVRFSEGDVIFAKITPCMENGKTAPVIGIPGGYAAGSTEFHVLRPRAVDTRYLWYWLVRHAFRNEAERNMSGSAGQLQVPVDYLRNSHIPVAPLPEQRRIVTRIDELFAEIAEGEAALERAREGLDTWRRALLKAAVTGELTRDRREAKRPAETGTGVAVITRYDASAHQPSPFGWSWTTIGEAGQVLLGRQRAPQHHSGPNMRPYLRVANVLEDRIDFSDVKYMNFTPSEFARYHLEPGDILLNEGQSLDLVGRSAIYKGEIEDCCFQKTLLRFRASQNVIPEYAQKAYPSASGNAKCCSGEGQVCRTNHEHNRPRWPW